MTGEESRADGFAEETRVAHLYVSTACQHELHRARCRLVCKYCGTPCLCPCHQDGPTYDA